MTQAQLTSAPTLFVALEAFCRAGRTGVFRIVTDQNHAASVGLSAGRIVAARYRIKRGAEALPLLAQVQAGQYSFKEGESLGEDPALPHSSEILAALLKENPAASTAPTPGAAPVSPTPATPPAPAEATLSPAARAVLEAALAEHIGPMAGILVRKASAQTSDLAQLVTALAGKIPNAERARQFEAEVRRKLV